jgi:hypothetical protein
MERFMGAAALSNSIGMDRGNCNARIDGVIFDAGIVGLQGAGRQEDWYTKMLVD